MPFLKRPHPWVLLWTSILFLVEAQSGHGLAPQDERHSMGPLPIQVRLEGEVPDITTRLVLRAQGPSRRSISLVRRSVTEASACFLPHKTRTWTAEQPGPPPFEDFHWRVQDLEGHWQGELIHEEYTNDKRTTWEGSFVMRSTGRLRLQGERPRVPRPTGVGGAVRPAPTDLQITVDAYDPATGRITAWDLGTHWLTPGRYRVGVHQGHFPSQWKVVEVKARQTTTIPFAFTDPFSSTPLIGRVRWHCDLPSLGFRDWHMQVRPASPGATPATWNIVAQSGMICFPNPKLPRPPAPDARATQEPAGEHSLFHFELPWMPAGPFQVDFPDDIRLAWSTQQASGWLEVHTEPWSSQGPCAWSIDVTFPPHEIPPHIDPPPDRTARIQTLDTDGAPHWTLIGIETKAYAPPSIPSLPHQMAVGAPGYQTQYFTPNHFQPSQATDPTPHLTVALQPGFATQLTVQNTQSQPIPGATIEANGIPVATTNIQGQASILLPKQPTALIIQTPNHQHYLPQPPNTWLPYQTVTLPN